MPKVVDHDERRAQIVSAALRLMASEGVDAATTRRIAEVTGYSNGSLRYYFPGKDSVITAAFERIFADTNARAAAADPDPHGLPGLRSLCLEIMPLDEQRLDEARIAIAFWHRALHDPAMAALHAGTLNEWRTTTTRRLHEGVSDGEVSDRVHVPSAVDELLSMLIGLQILAVLSPADTVPERQHAQLDAFIERLRPATGAHPGPPDVGAARIVRR